MLFWMLSADSRAFSIFIQMPTASRIWASHGTITIDIMLVMDCTEIWTDSIILVLFTFFANLRTFTVLIHLPMANRACRAFVNPYLA